ncbi:MAG: hypothetical protein ACR2KV_06500, partial [Solirubrobacteraceae bacterium]
MEKLGDRSPERIGEIAQQTESGVSWPERCAAESRAYLIRVCGPMVAGPVIERALRDVARLAGGGTRPPSAPVVGRIRATVWEAALDATERSAAGLGERLRRLTGLRVGCTKLPALLRDRAAGRLSPGDVEALERRLERCPDCAGLTRRLDAADWHLEQALSRPARVVPVPSARSTNGGGRRAVRAAAD